MPAKQTVGQTKQTKPLPKAGPETEEQQQPQAGAGVSKADLFNDTAPEEGFQAPLGQHMVILVGAEWKVDGEKESIEITYEIEDSADDENIGKEVKTWYNLFDKDGKPQRGAGFWKRDLELMGREPIAYEDLEDGLRLLADERLHCIINVKKNKEGYTNVFFSGLQE